MGLFDRLANRTGSGSGKNKGEKESELAEYSGMRVEVMDIKGEFLFLARINVSWEGNMGLEPVTAPPDELLQRTSIPVSLRGYDEAVRKAIHMDCIIDRRKDGVWEARRIEAVEKKNDRAFFRQNTSARGEIMKLGRGGIDSRSCELVNISAGGVCFRAEETYGLGDKVMLNSDLVSGWELAPLVCVVRRVTRKRGGVYEYGCEFQNLSPATEDILARAIMEMQRKRMQRE